MRFGLGSTEKRYTYGVFEDEAYEYFRSAEFEVVCDRRLTLLAA